MNTLERLLYCPITPKEAAAASDEKKHKKQSREDQAEATVDTKGWAGLLGDLVGPWAVERAGRSTGVAMAGGKDYASVPFRIRNPGTGMLGDTLLGSTLGTGLGAGLGALLGAGGGVGGMMPVSDGAIIGAAGGAGTGLAAGAIYNLLKRRAHMRKINKMFGASTNDITAQPNTTSLSSFLPVNSGTHLKGQMDALRYLKGESQTPISHPIGSTVANVATVAIPHLQIPMDIGKNFYARHMLSQPKKTTTTTTTGTPR